MSDLIAAASLAPVLARHGIGLLVAFGSRVRGTATEASDLDLGCERADGRRMSFLELGLLRDELAALTPERVDLIDLAAADAIMRFEIATDGHALAAASPDAWTSFVARTLVDHDDIAHALPALIAGVERAARSGGGRR
jgi:predicted nucleotidyltransferase